MSKKSKVSKSMQYEDFVSASPDTILLYTPDQKPLLDEHSDIIGALSGANLTVKQIHRLYLEDPDERTYSKTLKTVYRHLDALEEKNLIKVAGYRKYEGSRQTEKLYCRAAEVYYPAEETKSNWWNTDEGRELFRKTYTVADKFFEMKNSTEKKFIDMLIEYNVTWGGVVRQLFEETSKNESLAELFSNVDLYEIKEIARTIGLLGVISKNPSLVKTIQSWLDN